MRQGVIFVTLYGLGSILGFTKFFLISSKIDPNILGLYVLILLSVAYLSYASSIGIFDSFLVCFSGEGITKRGLELVNTGLSVSLILSCLVSIFVGLVSLKLKIFAETNLNVISLITFAVIQIRLNALMCILQGTGKIISYALSLIVRNIFPILLLLLVKFGIGINNILIFEIITVSALILFLHFKLKIPIFVIHSSTYIENLKYMIGLGAPFTITSVAQHIHTNIDKYFVAIFYNYTTMGIYAFVSQLVLGGTIFSGMVNVYFLPVLLREHTKKKNLTKLFFKILFLSIISFIVAILILLPVWLFGPDIIGVYFPKYVLAVEYLPLVLAVAAIIMSNQFELYFRVQKLGRLYIIIQSIGMLLTITILPLISYLYRDFSVFLLTLIFLRLMYLCICIYFSAKHSFLDQSYG